MLDLHRRCRGRSTIATIATIATILAVELESKPAGALLLEHNAAPAIIEQQPRAHLIYLADEQQGLHKEFSQQQGILK